MNDFVDSPLLGSMAKALLADIDNVPVNALFPCRPLAAATAGGRTMLGRFKGDIYLSTNKEFKDALEDLARDGPQKIVLDLAKTALSKSAVGTLLSFAAEGHGRNSRLYLYRPSKQIRDALKGLGLLGFFSFLETEEDFMATLIL